MGHRDTRPRGALYKSIPNTMPSTCVDRRRDEVCGLRSVWDTGSQPKNTGVMKHTTGPRRGRSRGNGKRFSTGGGGGGGGKNQNFESSGPDVKIRGTAQQIYEKYLSLARDAVSAGDRILAEGYFQFADHYYRIFNAANGNGQARPDQNNRIPPPPESAAGGFVGDDTGMGAGDGGADDGMDDEDDDDTPRSREGDQPRSEFSAPQRPADEFRPHRPAEPINRSRVVEEAAPAVQAEELAEALARGEDDNDGPADDRPAPGTDEAADAAADDAPRRGRRTLGLNLGGRRTLGRRSQKAAESEAPAAESAGGEAPAAADVPSSETREGGFLGPKPIRRRVRRVTPKPKEPAGAA